MTDTSYCTTDYPQCPYCGQKRDEYGDLEEGENTLICGMCEKEYVVDLSIIYLFESKPSNSNGGM